MIIPLTHVWIIWSGRVGRGIRCVACDHDKCWPIESTNKTGGPRRLFQYWVVEFDIKAAFDQIDHGLLMKAVGSHIKESWIRL